MLADNQSVDVLADLRPDYVERLRSRIEALSLFLIDCALGEPSDDAFENNHRCVHSMVSSASIFGHAELSQAARAAERAFECTGPAKSQTVMEPVAQLVKRAEQVVQAYERSMP